LVPASSRPGLSFAEAAERVATLPEAPPPLTFPAGAGKKAGPGGPALCGQRKLADSSFWFAIKIKPGGNY